MRTRHSWFLLPIALLLAWTATVGAAAPAAPRSAVAAFQHPLRTAAPPAGRPLRAAQAAAAGEVGYIPCDVAHAYGLGPSGLNGAGLTIAVIVASHEPNLQTDIPAFDSALPVLDPAI